MTKEYTTIKEMQEAQAEAVAMMSEAGLLEPRCNINMRSGGRCEVWLFFSNSSALRGGFKGIDAPTALAAMDKAFAYIRSLPEESP